MILIDTIGLHVGMTFMPFTIGALVVVFLIMLCSFLFSALARRAEEGSQKQRVFRTIHIVLRVLFYICIVLLLLFFYMYADIRESISELST